MEFSSWLLHQYLNWQSELGQRKSVSAFAGHVGVSQPQMTAYLKGQYLPKGENLGKMAAVLGVEVYDVLGMPRPAERTSPLLKWASEILDDPEVAEMMKAIFHMPEELRSPTLEFVTDLLLALYRIQDPEKRKRIMLRLLNFEKEISDQEARDLLA